MQCRHKDNFPEMLPSQSPRPEAGDFESNISSQAAIGPKAVVHSPLMGSARDYQKIGTSR
jgi:hypothetical protein